MSLPCGYDEEFVESPPDYLKCAICCLVLKDPVQIMKCGHRYCSMCFQQMKSYSQHLSSPLVCPVDREEIDLAKVFDDTGMTRIICDLKVKCSFNSKGCEWTGELRSLDAHRTSCTHNVKPALHSMEVCAEGNALRITEMNNRMDKLEEILYEKDKDIAHMKLTLMRSKEEMDLKNEEMKALVSKTLDMRKEIVTLQESNKVLQENFSKMEGKYENHRLRLDKLEVEENTRCDTEMINLKTDVVGIMEDLNQIKIHNSANKSANSTEDMECKLRILKGELKKLENDNRSRQGGSAKSLAELKSQLGELQSRTGGSLSNIKQELFEELDILHTQQLHVNQTHERTQFTWKISDFRHRFNAKERCESPKFYCAPHGHICQLICEFKPEIDDMGIFIRLCKGRSIPDSKLFVFDVVWELIYNDGSTNEWTLRITDDLIQKCFTFQGSEKSTLGCGIWHFFSKAKLNEYVKDDSCTITCSLKPSN